MRTTVRVYNRIFTKIVSSVLRKVVLNYSVYTCDGYPISKCYLRYIVDKQWLLNWKIHNKTSLIIQRSGTQDLIAFRKYSKMPLFWIFFLLLWAILKIPEWGIRKNIDALLLTRWKVYPSIWIFHDFVRCAFFSQFII